MNTEKREERLRSFTPQEFELERASIQNAAMKWAVEQQLGVTDTGGGVSTKEVIDWRVETFNNALEYRPDLGVRPMDRNTVYTAAVEHARELSEEVRARFYNQWDRHPDPIAGTQETLVDLYQRRELIIAGLQQQQIETMQAIIGQSREAQLGEQFVTAQTAGDANRSAYFVATDVDPSVELVFDDDLLASHLSGKEQAYEIGV